MPVICQHCEAKKWKGETPGMYCSGGKVQLPRLVDPPEPLRTLLIGDSAEAKHFLTNIRRYNSFFQMTSFGTTKEIREPGYMPTFKVQGQVYHRIGSLYPLSNEEPKFLQIYLVGDGTQQAEQRCKNVPQTRQDIFLQLQDLLNHHNCYVHSFKSTMNKISPEFKVVILADKAPHGEHERRFNAPATGEVALIMVGEQHGARDIILEERSGIIKKIPDTHRSYDALQYPFLFWQGEDGYHFELRQRNPMTGLPQSKKISAMQFYAYRMMKRSSDFIILLRSNALFHQFIVDMYAKIESERLLYIRLNHGTLRVEK
ncbi:hypothetical protein AVEN_175615-1 [Araneus ventricosus]|uniref:Helitron helicase-like domain-containing protein n=1 Tax=Araneus ventricosus TaxID=182803 RepID=A0A4Y2FVV5_ARAVE|nr:hypothetical protein AVEN_175615-1 [Araneus ventricosus]